MCGCERQRRLPPRHVRRDFGRANKLHPTTLVSPRFSLNLARKSSNVQEIERSVACQVVCNGALAIALRTILTHADVPREAAKRKPRTFAASPAPREQG